MINKKNKSFLFIIILIFLGIAIHWVWFFNLNIFTWGDWLYLFSENSKEFLSMPNYWSTYSMGGINSIGGIDLVISAYPYKLLEGIFSTIGIKLYDRIVFLWPIVILPIIGSYYLLKKITKNNIAASIGSLAFCYNTYFLILRAGGQLTLLASFILAPFIFLFYIKALEEKKLYLAFISGLISFTSSFFDFRCFYIISILLLLYFLYYIFLIYRDFKKKNLLRTILLALIPFMTVLLLNLYWILYFILKNYFSNNEFFNREIFGNQFMNIFRAITIFHPFWTGSKPAIFVVQTIPWYFWIIPIFAFLGLILNRKNKTVLFFGLISFIGIILSKQAGRPFPNLYSWLYYNFPGFNAFREASKFYFLTIIGYSVLISSFIGWLWQNFLKVKLKIAVKYLLTFLIVILFLWNAKPIITGEIGTMFVPKQIPGDYMILKNYIFNQESYFRTLWVPADSRWGFYNNNHPKISIANIIGAEWKDFDSDLIDISSEERFNIFFKQELFNNLIDVTSIKYIIVPIRDKENDDDFYIYYGDDRNFYVEGLKKMTFLKYIEIGTSELKVFQNEDFKPHIYVTDEKETIYKNVPFQKIDYKVNNPSEYIVNLKNISKPIFLNFSEKFDSDWKVKLGNFKWFIPLVDKNYFLPDKNHFENDANLNSFLIDPEYIKSNLPKNTYIINKDGSIDIKLVLYFKAQSYLYLGFIVSVLTFLIILLYLCSYYFKKRGILQK